MKSKIAILGCSPTGIQSAVYLLEQYRGEILLYDRDLDYAKGMALDCMQASSIMPWQGRIRIAGSIEELSDNNLLIICENLNRSLDDDWIEATRRAKCGIFASTFDGAISSALKGGVSESSILGVQGLMDAKMIADELSRIMNISIEDIQVMVYGGTGKKMKSSPDLIRVGGIPIHLISEDLFDTLMSKTLANIPYEDEPWPPYYSLSSAAVRLALLLKSGQKAILPINGAQGTFPCLVGNYGIQKVYKELVEV